MITDAGHLAFGRRSHTGTKDALGLDVSLSSSRSSEPHSLEFLLPLQTNGRHYPNLDSEPFSSDANPGIAGALTFARSAPTRSESVGGPRFFRTHRARVDGPIRHRSGMNLSMEPDSRSRSAQKQGEFSVQESVVRTRLRVLPPVGTGGTSRTWLTSDDVRVAL